MAIAGQQTDIAAPSSTAADLAGAVVLAQSKSLTATGNLFDVDTNGAKRVIVHVTSAGTTCTITYEGSNDRANWLGVSGYAPTAPATETVATTTTAVATVFRCDYQFFRARISTYGSGTVTANCLLRGL